MTRVFHWFFYVKDGSHVRLWHPSCVYTTAQRQHTAVQKMCTLLKKLSLPYILGSANYLGSKRILWGSWPQPPPFLAEGCINIQIRNKWCCRRKQWLRNLRHKVTKNIFCKIWATMELFKMWFTVYRKLELIHLSNVCL